ncbi:MAG TPA: 50S ribosomal protein L10 [Terriglobia bacterium]|nr:50S ribosomal protein L10 [Terriglobia bacterium]
MKREEKHQQSKDLHEELKKARTIFLTGFEGLTVAQDTELRRQITRTGARYKVVKNSLIERAATGTDAAPTAQNLRGTTSLAYTAATDPVSLAKVLVEYAKENPALVFKAGMVEGRVVSLAEVEALASLPSREELFAKALFMMKAPAQQLATAISAVARDLARVIQQAVKEQKFQASGGN